MKHSIVLAALAVVSLATVASAQTLPGGSIQLTWDECYQGGDGGGSNKSFSCDADPAEPFVLVASVIPPEGLTQYVGHVGVFDFLSATSAMPDWWSFGSCQPATGIVAVPGAGDTSCPDLVDLPQFGGQDFAVPFGSPNRARLRTAYAINADLAGPLQSTQEATVLRIRIAGARTAAPGACSGCPTGVCIVFTSLLLDQADPALPRFLISSGEQQVVAWNGTLFGSTCITPARPSTWGQLKSLYR